MTCVALTFSLVLLTVLIVKDTELSIDERTSMIKGPIYNLYISMQIIDFVLITSTIVTLLVYLKK